MVSGKRPRTTLSEINVTPLVDVMLVLLIIFMITAPMLQRGVDVNLPVATGTPQPQREAQVILTITKQGQIYVNQTAYRLEALRPKLHALYQARRNRDIFLRADADVPYGTVVRVMDEVKKAGILKLGMTHPLPERMIAQFLLAHRKIIIIEELEPYLETQLKALAKDCAPNVEIYGKTVEHYFSRKGELSTREVAASLAKITGRKLAIDFERIDERYIGITEGLPSRPPILCAGCPHRASFYVINKVGKDEAVYPTDIGCYALGIAPPLSVGDLLICMGSSVSTAQGISRVTGRNTIAIMGDSTFFHAAIPGLTNAVYNNSKITLVVLDNATTAMTGHQPHPGTGITGLGNHSERVHIERVAEGCGVKYVKAVDPFKIEEATRILEQALQQSGPSVVIFRAPCVLEVARKRRRAGVEITPFNIADKCTNCMTCVALLGCPALGVKNSEVSIDKSLCTACGLCASLCPFKCIEGSCLT